MFPSLFFAVDKARVLFPYVAENEDELSIEEGDIINVLDRELEDSGWWKGELNGKVGVFPDNFVDIIPAEDVSCFYVWTSKTLNIRRARITRVI